MRIRSIKPEFWRDEKIATLKNKLAGYFFIGLWNVADDEGKFPFNPKALALQLPIFRSKEVVTYLSELSQKGLIMESECSQWGLITNWKHQKIDRPQVPTVKKESIQWVNKRHSTNSRDHSTNIRRKDRIGKDRIGKDRIPIGDATRKIVEFAADESGGSQVWNSYSIAFESRYGVKPTRNAKTNSQCKQLFERLGKDAIEVVKFYLTHNDGFYIKKQHSIGLCLQDAESLHTQWQRGVAVTTAQVRQAEKVITNHDAFSDYCKMLDSQEKGEK